MAASATPRPAELGHYPRVIAVAYSGGRDSTALLHATAHAAQTLNAGGAQLQVLALHIHHGLSSLADDWLLRCQAQCEAWVAQGLPLRLRCHRLSERPAATQSIEAWAREQRYAALRSMAVEAGADLLLLAHHRRDQAETFVLQALRGAGTAGLAAMPALQWRDGICWARPWLARPREQVEAYVQAHGLSFVEDDSNSDPRYARNRLRLQVWPALGEAFPQAEASLAQAADWAQQALDLQAEVAEQDLQGRVSEAGLEMAAVLALSPARASNALRAWLSLALGQAASASLVRRLLRECVPGTAGLWPCPGGGQLRFYRGRLQRCSGQKTLPTAPAPRCLDLGKVGIVDCEDWGGCWRVEAVESGGVAPARLHRVILAARSGGEQFQRAPHSVPRSLKKAFQEAGMPAADRQGPLLWIDSALLFVPGLGLDARQLAAPGEAQLSLKWLPHAPGLAQGSS
ncbi:tRNA(Ile)-lysidine synthase [Paucibacter oligotrophus]|uniref:tRNA(Ile)-lysidine synthase n=1 Tax=Roseateles oligotrophus TaxID=1769250 RepID=A0A840L917_9BURK|nr:tRNA lysidine(34) synthetase TilS [Roseateles oligotrophus]MBB4841867.1 tRNA(Ile)-lysidine synthase [Roseateles oligotrophus]